MRLVIHPSPEATSAAATKRIVELVSATDDRFTLGLAGGNTPAATYRSLRHHPLTWRNVDAWLPDERWVPHHHERSNGRMAAENLLHHVAARFHRPHWSETIEAHDSAALYEEAIRSIHPEGRPDLVLLGMGEDGHTASLFPGTEALTERDRWIVANEVPQQDEVRITATYPLLWNAERIVVLAVGEGKAEALRDSMEGKTPAGRLGEGDAEVEWHVDEAAASLVS